VSDSRSRTRASIVQSAARLLHEQGADAVTTRAVAQAAGMQAPTIYRFFEDKEALLDAVAEHVFATYVSGKTLVEDGDPIADLRAGWDAHIDFGLANAALFGLLIDPARGGGSPAAEAGLAVCGPGCAGSRRSAGSGSRSAAPWSSSTPPAPARCSRCSAPRRSSATPASPAPCTTP